MLFLKLIIFLASAVLLCSGKNVVLILVDDLDSVLDGMTPLSYTQRLIGKEGVTFTNAFTAVPICCPNRASILTGRYQHNHKTFNNSLSGGCSDINWQTTQEPNTFAAILKNKRNYKTFYAGKYLNQYGDKRAGGVSHVPPGWDQWYGLVGNSKYYDYSLSINGAEKKFGSSPNEYLTDVVKNYATDFIKRLRNEEDFLMVLAPPAPHAPFTPAHRHADKYKGQKVKKDQKL